jgi:hypothetical protein
MSQEAKLPSQEQFNAFASRLKEYRGTLGKEDQHMFDAMVAAAFRQENQGDVQGYWWAPAPAYPAWYGAPVYYGTPWAYSYSYGYPYYWP